LLHLITRSIFLGKLCAYVTNFQRHLHSHLSARSPSSTSICVREFYDPLRYSNSRSPTSLPLLFLTSFGAIVDFSRKFFLLHLSHLLRRRCRLDLQSLSRARPTNVATSCSCKKQTVSNHQLLFIFSQRIYEQLSQTSGASRKFALAIHKFAREKNKRQRWLLTVCFFLILIVYWSLMVDELKWRARSSLKFFARTLFNSSHFKLLIL
jgi:hypothetical protein